MSDGAPAVTTNFFYHGYTSNPKQDAEAAVFRAKHVGSVVPIYETNIQYSVPGQMYNRGWVSPDVPVAVGPTYPAPVMAPQVPWINKTYAGLIMKSAATPKMPNRQAQLVGAPTVQTTF